MMEFGNLAAWWAGLLALPIVIFYVLKVRLRRRPVSTVMFWDQVFEDKRPRRLWQELRHWLSLAAQLLLLALLVAALIDPFLPWQSLQARRVVLVLDHSASMNTVDAGGTARLVEARSRGYAWIRGLRLRDEMAVIAAGSSPQVVCGLTSHQRTLRTALANVPPSDSPTRLASAVELARRLLADHPHGSIVLLTDGCFPADELEQDERLEVVQVGDAVDNLGITQFQVRRSLNDPIGYQTLIEVRRFGAAGEPAADSTSAGLTQSPSVSATPNSSLRLELELDGELVDVVPINFDDAGRWTHVNDHTSAAGGPLRARLRTADGEGGYQDALAADNEAVALLPERNRQPVLLVGKPNLFLEHVFASIPLVELTVEKQLPDDVPPNAIVVFHREIPKQLPTGRTIVIDPVRASELWELGGLVQNPIIARQQVDSPLMTHVRLDSSNILMPEARRLTIRGEHEVLAATVEDEPIYCAVERPGSRTLILTVNLDKGDLPLRTAFPILMSNAVSWFQQDKGELRPALAAGTTYDVDLADLQAATATAAGTAGRSSAPIDSRPASRFVLHSPDGRRFPLPPGTGRTTVGPLDATGIWWIAADPPANESGGVAGEPTAAQGTAQGIRYQLACNLANEQESRIAPPTSGGSLAKAGVLGLGGRPIWFYLVFTALILMTVEWYLYQRRWIG